MTSMRVCYQITIYLGSLALVLLVGSEFNFAFWQGRFQAEKLLRNVDRFPY